jgi:5,10-methylenetetrahydrofolate reductase
MRYGPCGGVRADLDCEMAAIPCPFATRGVVPWSGPPPPAHRAVPPLLATAARRPVVLTDLTVRPYDRAGLSEVVRVLAPVSDGLLVGEHQGRPDFPPTVMASLIAEAGGRAWATLTCRDRNRIVLEQDLAGLVLAGAAGVLCVTGDGRAPGVRPDVTQVFDVDGTRLAAMAAAAGLPVAVPESPDAPPRGLRAARLRQKQDAGAQLCVLNHVGSPARLSGFAAECRDAGTTLPLIASVAVYTDEHSASVLQRFPGLALSRSAVDAVLGAADPVAAGIAAAVAEARALLAVDGVVGVNLSGAASGRGELFAAGIKADVARCVAEIDTEEIDTEEIDTEEIDTTGRGAR